MQRPRPSSAFWLLAATVMAPFFGACGSTTDTSDAGDGGPVGGDGAVDPRPACGDGACDAGPGPDGRCIDTPDGWSSESFAAQDGVTRVELDAVPSFDHMDALIGLSQGAPTAFEDLAVIVRFNDAGMIDARNGPDYEADVALPYVAGNGYHIRMEVSVPAHLYSVFVTPEGGSELALATDYAFRETQADVSSLDHRGSWNNAGSGHQVCGFSVTGAAPCTPDCEGRACGASDGCGGTCDGSCEPGPTSTCIEPPVLQSPRVCTIPATGGECRFGYDEDGIVLFPDQVVTGQVNTRGGRNIHVIGGHIRLENHEHYVMAFDEGTNVFVEGTYADANGNCDVFAIRNHREHQMHVTFQNVYATGPTYNNPRVAGGDCHGDLIQNQGTRGGGLELTVENFVGVTAAQGLFLPRFEPVGQELNSLRNVYIRERDPAEPTYGLLWFWSYTYNSGTYTPYAANLTNVNVAWGGTWLPLLPQAGTLAGDVYDFEEPLITGVVNRWSPDGTDLGYPAHTGLNYDRSHFCSPAE